MPVADHSELEWNDLLSAIESRQVIPIIGEGVVTAPPELDTGSLNAWLAGRLAESLKLDPAAIRGPLTLSKVVSAHLLAGQPRGRIYSRLKQILDQHATRITPQPPLLDLAAVRDFTLFVSTTFDSLLADALNRVRHGGAPQTGLAAYHPSAHGQEKDTPTRKNQLPPGATLVAQLMGRASTKPDYAVWDEDLLEFILALHADFRERQMPNLAYDLQDNHLLFIGLGFSDWLTRFFVRVAGQRRLSEAAETTRFLALDGATAEDSLVLFFDSVQQSTTVWPGDPAAFVAELRRRWEARNGPAPSPTLADDFAWPAREMPANSIFLSYASEDRDAVKQLKTGLEAHGCAPVWFDVERLQAGDHWRNALETEIRKRCAVFVSVISRRTIEKIGEVHREREWAEDTAPIFGAGATFYVPVIIDDLPIEEVRREPLKLFKPTHAARLPGGTVTPEFAAQIRRFQQENRR